MKNHKSTKMRYPPQALEHSTETMHVFKLGQAEDHDPGWYFWDESATCLCGPFEREEDAVTCFKGLCEQLNPEPAPPAPKMSLEEKIRDAVTPFLVKESEHEKGIFFLKDSKAHGPKGWYFYNSEANSMEGPYDSEGQAIHFFHQYKERMNKEKITPPVPSAVNHPAHYNQGMIEIIDFTEDQELNANLFNVVKYATRANHKGKDIEDLEKAFWYLDREIKRRKGTLVTTTEKNFAKKFRENEDEWNAVLNPGDENIVTFTLRDGTTFEGVKKPDGTIVFHGVRKE